MFPKLGDISNDTSTEIDRFDICLVLSLINLLMFGSEQWYTKTLLLVLVLPAIVFKSFRFSVGIWMAIALVMIFGIYYDWASTDNHKYVMCYWSVAIGCTLLAGREQYLSVISTNGRLILGFLMAFAAFWKITSTTYISGAFFEMTFLTDERFAGMIATVTDLSSEDLQENRSRLFLLRQGYTDNINPETQELISSNSVDWLAFFATWWTVVIEALAAILFLVNIKSRKYISLRNVVLIVFGVTTYAIAPVPGFGCVLVCMGLSLCLDPDDKFWFYLYASLFLFIILSTYGGSNLWKMVG